MPTKVKKGLDGRELLVLSALALVLSCAWLYAAGINAGGMHHIDDNFTYSIMYRLYDLNTPLSEVIWEDLVNDLKIRFRPLYYPLWAIKTYFFRDQWYLYSIANVLCGMWASLALIIAFRLIRFSWIACIIVVFGTFAGPQIEGFVLRFAQEAVGTALMASAILFAVLCHQAPGWRNLFIALFLVSVLLMSLYKESFLLLIPALMVMWVSLSARGSIKWKYALNREWPVLLSLGLIFIAGVAGVLISGANNPANYYTPSLERVLTLNWAIARYRELLPPRDSLPLGLLAFATALIAGGMALWLKSRKKTAFDERRWAAYRQILLISILWIGSQLAAYAGTGFAMNGRYYLPVTFGIALALAGACEAARGILALRILAVTASVVFLIPTAIRGIEIREHQVKHRNEFARFLDHVQGVYAPYVGNCQRQILVVWDPARAEEMHTFHRWMTHKVKATRCQMTMYPVKLPSFQGNWEASANLAVNYYSKNSTATLTADETVEAIAIYRGGEKPFLESGGKAWISDDMVRFLLDGGYVVYGRRPE